MLEVFSFVKNYNDHLVLEVPKLVVSKGVSWFQGVNGSGKSTFFKAIAGLIPFDGEVKFNTINLKKDPVLFRRKVNYSYAEPRYPHFLSGKEILDYHQKVYASDLSEVNDLIDSFGVQEYYRKPIGGYSSGMLKKISLIAAMIGEPELLLLDEPLTTIDSQSQINLLEYLSGKKCDILIASHHELPESSLKTDHIFSVKDQTITQIK